jgi:hypothetical protein
VRAAQLDQALYFYRDPTPINLAHYVQGSRELRRILQQYGPPVVGVGRTKWLQLLAYLKEVLYRAAWHAKLDHLLVHRRYHPLDPATKVRATEELARLRTTSVPGL